MRPAIPAITAAAMLAGCGSGSTSSEPTGGSTPTASSHIAFPLGAASGTVLSVSGSDVQVDTTHGARSVRLEPSTTYMKLTPTMRSALAVGDCVGITSGLEQAGASQVKAVAVSVVSTSPCARPTAGAGSPPAGSGSAAPDIAGSSSTTTTGSGAAGQLVATVTSLHPNSLVVKSFATGSKPVTIRTTARTRYERERSADASAVQPGACVAIAGQKPGTTVDAVTVTIFAPCSLAGTAPDP